MYSEIVTAKDTDNLNEIINNFLEIAQEYELCNVQFIEGDNEKFTFFVVYKERDYMPYYTKDTSSVDHQAVAN